MHYAHFFENYEKLKYWLYQEKFAELEELIKDGDRELFEDILSNIVRRKIRAKINGSLWRRF